jgi:uncharacterized protein HemX
MFDSSTFEHQPLVPISSGGKFDIDSFLAEAKSSQKKNLIFASILAILSLGYGGYLLSQFPTRLIQQSRRPQQQQARQQKHRILIRVVNEQMVSPRK